ncbi:Chemotaxis protein methyltransferase CheR [Candidatus Burkholderia verschuerenii]|uniref:histidine kinase n=1 Tax=Candidatus Burkholderia verschuerenii TaxID=242163 RepID=A0A0L0M5N0_9BURK|nr:chemotaxis protein CheB [Candidatus Burkholderia verschuerenii]KND57678.1 Chemotaxis protein methyltransferase CheR [Candidatus Burkholderia verschuerenii]
MDPAELLRDTESADAAFDIVVIGASAGGVPALRELVDGLPADFPLPVVAMMHLPVGAQIEIALQRLPLPVQRLATDPSRPARYCCVRRTRMSSCFRTAPASCRRYWTTSDRDRSIVCSFRRRIVSARAIGVILSGMNNDGSIGARELREAGGRLLVQAPDDAEHADMPIAAIATGAVDLVVPIASLGEVIAEFAQGSPRPNALTELRAIEAAFGAVADVALAARDVDWQRTPLGSALTWPERLKLMIRETLDSAHPSAIWWGPQLTEIYNDAWRPFLGPKHPGALGKPARQTWENEWGRIGPLVESVFHDGEAIAGEELPLLVIRNDVLEQAFISFSYTPLRDIAGKVLGVRCTIWETTRTIVAQRRMRLLQTLSTCMARALTRHEACTLAADALATDPSEVPFALLYLIDAQRRQATLACAARLDAGSDAAPRVVHIDRDIAETWPLAKVLPDSPSETCPPFLIESIQRYLPLRGNVQPERAVLAAVQAVPPGVTQGVLVLGLSRHRPFDEAYLRFVEALSRQLASGLGDARSKELERERLDQLTTLDRAKTDFFSNVSHEFRTPLTLLLVPLEELARGHDALPEPIGRQLDVAVRNARRLLRLVNNLLDFSQMEMRGRQAPIAPADIAVLTADIASAFRSAIESAGMELRVEIGPDLPLVPVNNVHVGTNRLESAVERVQVHLRRHDHGKHQGAASACGTHRQRYGHRHSAR